RPHERPGQGSSYEAHRGARTRRAGALCLVASTRWPNESRRARGMRKIRSIGLCAAVALALSIVSAQSAPAQASSGTVLVLKAGGQVVPDGALVHVTAPSYFFKSKVTVEG